MIAHAIGNADGEPLRDHSPFIGRDGYDRAYERAKFMAGEYRRTYTVVKVTTQTLAVLHPPRPAP